MKPDVIIAFAFGVFRKQDQYKSPNWYIARQAEYLSKKFRIPIITQKDVPVDSTRLEVLFVEKNGYLFTLDIAEKAAELKERWGWHRAKVVAAPPHEWRCRRDLLRLGFKEVEGDYYLRFKFWFWHRFWFSEKSLQPWTRSRTRWWLREIPLRLMPWWLYKKIMD